MEQIADFYTHWEYTFNHAIEQWGYQHRRLSVWVSNKATAEYLTGVLLPASVIDPKQE